VAHHAAGAHVEERATRLAVSGSETNGQRAVVRREREAADPRGRFRSEPAEVEALSSLRPKSLNEHLRRCLVAVMCISLLGAAMPMQAGAAIIPTDRAISLEQRDA